MIPINQWKTKRASPAVLAALTLWIAAGCSDGRPVRTPVRGTVLYKGQPVEGAHVIFTPPHARVAAARTDSAGRFELRTFDPADGAVLGTHLVTISKMQSSNPSDPGAPQKTVLPEKYRRTETSRLTAEVTVDGANDFTFDLTD